MHLFFRLLTVEGVFKKAACPIRGREGRKRKSAAGPAPVRPAGQGDRAFKKVACPIRGREQGRKRKSAAGAQPAWQATALSKRWRVPYGGGNKAGNGRAQPAWQATALSKRWRVPYHGGGNKAEPTRTNPQKPTHKNQPTKTNPQKPTHKNQPTKTNPRSLFCSAGCISLLLVVCA